MRSANRSRGPFEAAGMAWAVGGNREMHVPALLGVLDRGANERVWTALADNPFVLAMASTTDPHGGSAAERRSRESFDHVEHQQRSKCRGGITKIPPSHRWRE
jgi:hypothetical protein